MPPKKKGLPAPIDRPLSRAYLREFKGWSTAFPPGVSEPTSLRLMENVLVNRDGSLRVRPGLKYLSRLPSNAPIDQAIVGTHEAFFLNDGSKAYLFAVREDNATVGFRVLTFDGADAEVHGLGDAGIDFDVPQTEAVLAFSSATTYVKYLQIDNKIIALSDGGETMRVFYVGAVKRAVKVTSIEEPSWATSDKLRVVHPSKTWIKSRTPSERINMLLNPSFEDGDFGWILNSVADSTMAAVTTQAKFGTQSLQVTATTGTSDVSVRTGYYVTADTLLSTEYALSAYIKSEVAGLNARVNLYWFDASGNFIAQSLGGNVLTSTTDWVRPEVIGPKPPFGAPASCMAYIHVDDVPAGTKVWIDGVLLEKNNELDTFFDDSMPDGGGYTYGLAPTASPDYFFQKVTYDPGPATIPDEVLARTADTLVSSNEADNVYNFGFFYTFSNEVGDSAASQITVVKAQRSWAAWKWEKPNAAGEPTGREVLDFRGAADQLVAYMPEAVWDTAVAQGATRWNLYMMSWSDQDAVPVEAMLIDSKVMDESSTYQAHGWARVEPPKIAASIETAPLPAEDNRINSSAPSAAQQGLVASDRLILVLDRGDQAVIRWTSNRAGEYLNFSSAKGGGYKTLSSGNLFVPAAVKLWQNPQSVDTLTILCLGVDGYSTAYYMAPAQVTSQSDAVTFMGFEETTATPGTTSPYGCEVLNNALYHPTETELMKSTASNYNISHKKMTDLISNMWADLSTKELIISSQLDNRLYYVVNNRHGVALEAGCRGNEIWVCDTGVEGGSWSRWLVPAQTLRKIEVDGRVVMSVVRPDGIFYFDELASTDEYVAAGAISTRSIDWKMETNTQGANRAHDAWAHLQQVTLTLGNFTGKVRWGVKGWDLHGKPIDASKVTRDDGAPSADGLPFDIEDHLAVRRDMKEWHFYAESVPGQPSSGQISLVQYRYTPVSVNVGYEYGSVETFEYGSAVAGTGSTTFNGVPIPAIDTRRP